MFSDFVQIFIDVPIWNPHPHIEQIAAPVIYTEPICVPAVIKLLFLVSLKMVSLLSYHNL